jgi:surface polysaccharide O-acyltransferase-like enzyme
MPSTAASTVVRLVFLDWLRILAFGLLVLYHVGMYYVGWDWHIKSPHAAAALEPWMRLVNPWRMDLLFVISGAATSLMLAGRGATGALLAARALRLLVPLLFGMLAIVPPQSYLEVVHKYNYGGTYAEFMRLYLTGYGGFCGTNGHCLILPTWNHLWFLPYLFLYTLMLWSALRAWPALLERLAVRVQQSLAGVRLFMLPLTFLALTRMTLQPRFPFTHALLNDTFAHTQYFAMFMLGAALARRPAAWEGFARSRWVALILGVGAWALLITWHGAASAPGGATTLVGPLMFSVLQWCGIVVALGFAQRHLNVDGAARRYFTEAVFPVYIVHQTLIIVLAHSLAPADLAPGLEGVVLIAGTFALSLLGFEIVRRLPLLRPLFGLGRPTAATHPLRMRNPAPL